jgi:N-acetyl-beta-hexosaminidase
MHHILVWTKIYYTQTTGSTVTYYCCTAVAKAAIESGVARKTDIDWDEYEETLRSRMGLDNKLIRALTDKAKENPKKVVFADANHPNILKAASVARLKVFVYLFC